MSSVYKFKLEIDVDTDGDFSYHGPTNVTYISEEFEILTDLLKDYFENLLTNIYGKDYVVDRIRNEVIYLVDILNTNNNYYVDMLTNHNKNDYYGGDKEIDIDLDNKSIKIELNLGNQNISVDLIKVVEVSGDGYQKIYNFK